MLIWSAQKEVSLAKKPEVVRECEERAGFCDAEVVMRIYVDL